jgi:hypothetical protein
MGWERLADCGFVVVCNMTGDLYLKVPQRAKNKSRICELR